MVEPNVQEEYQRQEDDKNQLIEDHIKLSKSLVNTPFDQLPKRKLTDKEQQDLEENFDVSKKLTFISNRIKYKDGTDLLFRFDSNLLQKSKDVNNEDKYGNSKTEKKLIDYLAEKKRKRRPSSNRF